MQRNAFKESVKFTKDNSHMDKMGSGKKDLEIVYNLQWKNVPGHSDDKANIVGMYDIPATTLNWETFKSYLLKNSGATGDDVKVSYVSIDDKEFPVESQLDFQIALYSFRQRARNGDIITLKLDRILDPARMGRMKRLRRSAEPRMEEEKVEIASESIAPAGIQNEGPPDWFKKYMKGFKKEIVEEVTSTVINYVSTMKTQNASQFSCYHSRKSKVECCKRPRKVPLALNKTDANEKEFMKSIKLERKLDCKLEKLEQKTMRVKEKKMALVCSNDADMNRSSNKSRPIGMPLSDTEFFMDASAVGNHESTIPHMSGGETYQQEWEVVNTGEMPWTESTELRYAWGSEALKPVEKSVPCPKLKPASKGTVVVYLEIPKKPGNYECYWHFYHEGRRFGHWLGCQVIVDASAVKLPSPIKIRPMDAKEPDPNAAVNTSWSWSSTPKKLKTDEAEFDALTRDNRNFCLLLAQEAATDKLLNTAVDVCVSEEIQNVSADLQELQIYDTIVIPDSSSDSDNQSIVSIADSNSSVNSAPSDEFVVVPMPSEKINNEETNVEALSLCSPVCTKVKLEKIFFVGDDTQESSAACDEPNIEDPVDQAQAESKSAVTYAYVTVNGQKIAVPKYLLRADYLEVAEDAPSPAGVAPLGENMDQSTVTVKSEEAQVKADNLNSTDSIFVSSKSSHCSLDGSTYLEMDPSKATGCANKSRLFVFPLNCPGFEVVYPPMNESLTASVGQNTTPNAPNAPNAPSSFEHFCTPMWGYSENVATDYPFNYTWPKSNPAYSYAPYAGVKWEPHGQQSFHDASSNDGSMRNKLHHRFGGYMRHRSPFNHAKHCSGGHCQQPLFRSKSLTPPARSPESSAYQQDSSATWNAERPSAMHILPDTLVSGAVNVASSAINTARSVLNMFSPQGNWSGNNDAESPRERALRVLAEMGFWNREVNATLLARYNDDVARVISELVQ